MSNNTIAQNNTTATTILEALAQFVKAIDPTADVTLENIESENGKGFCLVADSAEYGVSHFNFETNLENEEAVKRGFAFEQTLMEIAIMLKSKVATWVRKPSNEKRNWELTSIEDLGSDAAYNVYVALHESDKTDSKGNSLYGIKIDITSRNANERTVLYIDGYESASYLGI